jgi:hypothetical protein
MPCWIAPRSRPACICPPISTSVVLKARSPAPSTTAPMCLWDLQESAAAWWWRPIQPAKRRAGLASRVRASSTNSSSPNCREPPFTAADVVELYLHRGAFEPTLADEDQEQDPDRWCSHAPCGKARLASDQPMVICTVIGAFHNVESVRKTTLWKNTIQPCHNLYSRSLPHP